MPRVSNTKNGVTIAITTPRKQMPEETLIRFRTLRHYFAEMPGFAVIGLEHHGWAALVDWNEPSVRLSESDVVLLREYIEMWREYVA